jgi:PilZ domain/AMIN domain
VSYLQPRLPRVHFQHPVRVSPLDGPPRIIRTLTGNLSRHGAFVVMPEPLPLGARVALSLEAAGRTFPLAEGSVRWSRGGRAFAQGGFGMHFDRFLHPRGGELVADLVESLHQGRPLKPARRPRPWLRLGLWGLGAATLSATVTAGALAVLTPPLRSSAPRASPLAPAPLEPAVRAPEPAFAAALPVGAEEAPVGSEEPLGDLEAGPQGSAELEPLPVAVPPKAARVEGAGSGAGTGTATQDSTGAFRPAPRMAPPSPSRASGAGEASGPSPDRRSGDTRGQIALPSGAAGALGWALARRELRLTPVLRAGKLRRTFLLDGPPRVVFDLDGRPPGTSYVVPGARPYISRIRVGGQGAFTRVVVDLVRAPREAAEDGEAMVLSF